MIIMMTNGEYSDFGIICHYDADITEDQAKEFDGYVNQEARVKYDEYRTKNENEGHVHPYRDFGLFAQEAAKSWFQSHGIKYSEISVREVYASE